VSPVAVTSPTSTPQHTTRVFTAAINAANLAAATNCFAKDACLVTPDATAIKGREEIRQILAQLIDRRTQIEVLGSSVLVAGGVALSSDRWTISSAGAGGTVFAQELVPALVLRQLEGVWKLAVAAPWGWGGR
jgi:ketosteroid isomerase-like protein